MPDLSPHKTYDHAVQDPNLPAQWWFQQSPDGLVLFVVFYTQACRWARCLACNLPSKSSAERISYHAIMAQMDHICNDMPEVAARRDQIKKLIISNNGSILDEDTFPTTALMYVFAQANRWFPHLTRIAIESRPEYVDWDELAILGRLANEGTTPTIIELGIGFEAFDDRIRNQVFAKGLSLPVFEGLLDRLSETEHHLSCYFMLKPVPEMDDESAVSDIIRAIDYLDSQARRSGVPITMHLNPTYVATGTPLEPAFAAGTYQPPTLADVVRCVLAASERVVTLVVGLSDEGLAVPGGSFIRSGDEALVAALERYNCTQDATELAAMSVG